MNNHIYECVFFYKKLNLRFKISKGLILVIGSDSINNNNNTNDNNNNENKNENNNNNDDNNTNVNDGNYCQYCWNLCSQCPDIGSIVLSVNGVETNGLDKDFQLALLRNPQRPLVIRFKSPTDETTLYTFFNFIF